MGLTFSSVILYDYRPLVKYFSLSLGQRITFTNKIDSIYATGYLLYMNQSESCKESIVDFSGIVYSTL